MSKWIGQRSRGNTTTATRERRSARLLRRLRLRVRVRLDQGIRNLWGSRHKLLDGTLFE